MPTLEVLEDEVDKTFALAVMPYMPDSNSGSFDSIQEVIDFVGQILLVRIFSSSESCISICSVLDIGQGLEFMHVRFIAHWFVTAQLVMHDTQPLLS